MTPDCIFCKVVAGQLPCYKLYEDEHVLAFLDIGPLTPGHCLIVPRKHYARLDDIHEADAAVLAAIAALAPRLARAVMAATGANAWNLLQNNGQIAGQVVEHVHFHIIPRSEGDGLGYRWPAGKLDQQAAERLAPEISKGLG